MQSRLPLRTRIYLVMSFLVGITVMGGLVTIWYTQRIEQLLTNVIEKNLTAFEAASALENALVNQKGFLTYYFQDGNPDWLNQMADYRRLFTTRLQEAQDQTEHPEQRQALERIRNEYAQYIYDKDQVIAEYEAGRRQEGARLHQTVRMRFFTLINLCEEYKTMHAQLIAAAKHDSLAQASHLRIIAVAAMIVGLALVAILIVILVGQIFQPVNRLLEAASRGDNKAFTSNAVAALDRKVHGLLEDVDQTHIELARSRESLLQAEKLAMVGKLAAGMAHSIRNPFTSVKMRLFSLGRSLKLDSEQKEDFDVITEEIGHIDTIVQNFLEFSRPPKLKMQIVSPSTVVDMALQLLEHRLKSYDVTVSVERTQVLPEVSADPEQLKEVLVNLIINACEAMTNGGRIAIAERVAAISPTESETVLHIADNGPGIPEHLQEKIFQPFFTTKEEGTGLGLSIVERIIQEHGGKIRLDPREGMGATFIISLPVVEEGGR